MNHSSTSSSLSSQVSMDATMNVSSTSSSLSSQVSMDAAPSTPSQPVAPADYPRNSEEMFEQSQLSVDAMVGPEVSVSNDHRQQVNQPNQTPRNVSQPRPEVFKAEPIRKSEGVFNSFEASDSSYCCLSSNEASSSTTSDNWNDELKQYEDKMPPNLRMGFLDVLILYHEDDRDAAEKFRQHLMFDIKVDNGPIKALLYDDPDMVAICGSRIEDLEQAVQRSTYIFLFITKTFVSDKWSKICSDSCLMEAIENPNKMWCVVPVYTEKRNTSFKVPMVINALKGIRYYDDNQSYRESLAKLISHKIHVRIKEDKKHALEQKTWIECYKREQLEHNENWKMICSFEEENTRKAKERYQQETERQTEKYVLPKQPQNSSREKLNQDSLSSYGANSQLNRSSLGPTMPAFDLPNSTSSSCSASSNGNENWNGSSSVTTSPSSSWYRNDRNTSSVPNTHSYQQASVDGSQSLSPGNLDNDSLTDWPNEIDDSSRPCHKYSAPLNQEQAQYTQIVEKVCDSLVCKTHPTKTEINIQLNMNQMINVNQPVNVQTTHLYQPDKVQIGPHNSITENSINQASGDSDDDDKSSSQGVNDDENNTENPTVDNPMMKKVEVPSEARSHAELGTQGGTAPFSADGAPSTVAGVRHTSASPLIQANDKTDDIEGAHLTHAKEVSLAHEPKKEAAPKAKTTEQKENTSLPKNNESQSSIKSNKSFEISENIYSSEPENASAKSIDKDTHLLSSPENNTNKCKSSAAIVKPSAVMSPMAPDTSNENEDVTCDDEANVYNEDIGKSIDNAKLDSTNSDSQRSAMFFTGRPSKVNEFIFNRLNSSGSFSSVQSFEDGESI